MVLVLPGSPTRPPAGVLHSNTDDGKQDRSKSITGVAFCHGVLVLLEPQHILDADMVVPHRVLAKAVTRLAHLV